jgi:hypothetical protein
MYRYLKYAGLTVQIQTLASSPQLSNKGLGVRNSRPVMLLEWQKRNFCS